MFRTIFKLPQLIRLVKFTTVLSLITYQHRFKCTTNFTPKIINEKDLNAALTNPEYFTNTIIILNKDIIDDIPKTLQVKFCQYNGEFNEYDLIAINQHRCLLLKIRSEDDYLKLLNFFTPIATLNSRQEAIDLIDKMDAKVILSYVPQLVVGKQAEEQINKFDTFKQKNHKDLEHLEEQFRELRYIDINRDAQYYIIKDKTVAEQFNMSSNDIGEVYVLKATSIFTAKESSFFQNGKEYSMTKIEPDPNIENADHFRLSKKSHSLSSFVAESQEYSTNKLNLQRFVQRLSLMASNYVNYIYNKQQMDSQLLLYKQLGVKYILIYYTENDLKDKVVRKLINVKKSLNTEQQQHLGIIYSDNIQLLQSYFGLVSNEITDEIRLLDLESHQSDIQFKFKNVQLGQSSENINKFKQCKRYTFNDKFTTNRLRQFLVQTTNLNIPNFQKQPEQREEYYEKLFLRVPLENIQTMTSNSLNLSGFDLLYFYKPGCAACLNLSETLDKISQRLLQPNPFRVKNPANFKNIQIKKYNILNESQILPSPTQAPLIVALKNGETKQADLLQNKINPGDEEKVLHFLTKFIDSL